MGRLRLNANEIRNERDEALEKIEMLENKYVSSLNTLNVCFLYN